MNIVVKTHYLWSLEFAGTFSPTFVKSVDNHRSVVCESVGVLFGVESPPVHQNVYECRLLTVFLVFRIIVVLLVWDILNHKVEHLDCCRSQFILFLWLKDFFQQVGIRNVEFALFVGFYTFNLFEPLHSIFGCRCKFIIVLHFKVNNMKTFSPIYYILPFIQKIVLLNGIFLNSSLYIWRCKFEEVIG